MSATLRTKLAVSFLASGLMMGIASARAQSRRFPSASTPVTGVLVDAGGHPLAAHELHFEGRPSGDIFTVRTGSDGKFSTALPQGVYDLRGQHGAMIAGSVTVGSGPANLGNVRAPGMYNPSRALDHEEVGEEIVNSPAPSGAYVPNAGMAPQSVAVRPIRNPTVQGASQASAPAVVVPEEIEQQTRIPPGGDMSVGSPMGMAPGVATESTPTAPTGGSGNR
jgi:hypothetical protein